MTDSAPHGFTWHLTDHELANRPTIYRPELFAGKRFVVTGGGTGMGRAMTFLLARLGARVMIAGRREEVLRETQAAVKALTGAEIAVQPMTIRDPEQVDALLDRVWAASTRWSTTPAGNSRRTPSIIRARAGIRSLT